MNKNLNDAIDAVERADALMYAIENCYLTFTISPDEMELANRGVHTFYALWDAVRSAREALDKLEGDRKVVDVIYAVNATRRRDENGTLIEED